VPARPRVMAALGDSITRAFAACGHGGDCVEMSWATGTVEGLDSHWQRLDVDNREGNHNFAVSGARVAGLASQVRSAVRVRPDYVTALIGANDVCASDEAAMTSVEEFTGAFDAAIDTLVRGLPDVRILVLSVPDLARLWEVGKDRPDVRRVWESSGVCQSMLANPTDLSVDAQARRDRVRGRAQVYRLGQDHARRRSGTGRGDAETRLGCAVLRVEYIASRYMVKGVELSEQAILILSALADRPRHGYGVITEVAAMTGGRVILRAGTLYGALDRLARQGLVARDREEVDNGRLRRYYTLTDAGAEALQAQSERMAAAVKVATERLALRPGFGGAAGFGVSA
jgi:DNA-binding PadR family transcriptional regulator